MYGDTGSPNYAEHSVIEKPNKRTKMLKATIAFSAVAVFLLLFVVLSVFASALVIIMPMAAVVIAFGAWIFWKYTNVEYDYVISGGDIQMSVVYGGRSRKQLFRFKLSGAELFAGYNHSSPPREDGYAHRYACVSSMDAAGIVYTVFKNENGEKCIAYFEATKKVLSLLKFYNSSAYKVG